MITQFKSIVARSLPVLLMAGMMTLPAASRADMVSTPEIAESAQAQSQRAELQQLLARNDVSAYLASKGVSADDVQRRVHNLSDAEVAAFHQQLGELPAGEGALGIIIGVLVIFILLDVAGVTDIFPGV